MKEMTGPAMHKMRQRLVDAIEVFPDRREKYEERIAELDAELSKIHACIRCGRPLQGEESMARGYGPECAKKGSGDDDEE